MLKNAVAGVPNEMAQAPRSESTDVSMTSLALNPSNVTISSDAGRHPHLSGWRYGLVKVGLDCACASLLIGAFAVPGLLIAAAIALDAGGSVFYREERVGRGGRSFRIWKFPSMRESNLMVLSSQASRDSSLLHERINKNVNDDRITPIGRFLRRWSLDELPQLINVLRGEMSLVGPRPVVEEELPLYGELQHSYLAAIPGMSGLWQTSGRSDLSFDTRVQLDHSYVSSWTLRKDLRILARTLPAVLLRVGAR